MICYICGGNCERIITDLPFKITNETIVIIKKLPILQCSNCREFLIEDRVMQAIDEILERIDKNAELEIMSYAV